MMKKIINFQLLKNYVVSTRDSVKFVDNLNLTGPKSIRQARKLFDKYEKSIVMKHINKSTKNSYFSVKKKIGQCGELANILYTSLLSSTSLPNGTKIAKVNFKWDKDNHVGICVKLPQGYSWSNNRFDNIRYCDAWIAKGTQFGGIFHGYRFQKHKYNDGTGVFTKNQYSKTTFHLSKNADLGKCHYGMKISDVQTIKISSLNTLVQGFFCLNLDEKIDNVESNLKLKNRVC